MESGEISEKMNREPISVKGGINMVQRNNPRNPYSFRSVATIEKMVIIKKKNDQIPLFFLPLRKMNEITYVKKIRDETYPILHRI